MDWMCVLSLIQGCGVRAAGNSQEAQEQSLRGNGDTKPKASFN